MKKLLAIFIATSVILTFAACGDSNNTDRDDDEKESKKDKSSASLSLDSDDEEELAREILEEMGIDEEEFTEELMEELGIDEGDFQYDENSGADGTWSGAYTFYTTMTGKMDPLVNNMVDANNDRLKEENPDDYWNDPAMLSIFYIPFNSVSLASVIVI